jgi:hypothetical protein
MSTVMKSGKLRCDATCHTAKGTKCTCICGGKYHGASVLRSKTAERAEIEDIVLQKTIAADHAQTLKIIESVNEIPLDFGVSE